MKEKNKNTLQWFVFARPVNEDEYELVGRYPSKKEAEDSLEDILENEFFVIRGIEKEVVVNRAYIKD